MQSQNIVKDLANYDAELLGNASTELKSDMDFNIKGPGAGRKLMFLDQKLRNQFGDDYQQALKISLFTNAGRLTHYTSLKGDKNFAQVEQMITAHSETLNLARMHHSAQGNPVELARIETMLAGKNRDEVLAWSAKLGANVRAQHEKLLLEVDALELKYNKTKDPTLKAFLSKQITKKQMEANFFNHEAYIAPGSMMFEGGKSAAERRQTVMSQIEMITHKISEYHQSKGDVSKEYEVYKYLSRVHDELVASGIEIDPKLKTIFALSEGIYRGDRSFYDLKLRPKEDRQATLYAALEAIKDILPTIKDH